MAQPAESWETRPSWAGAVTAGRLETGEEALAWFETDLSIRLHYATSVVVLTTHRILSFDWPEGVRPDDANAADPTTYESWPVAGAELALRDHAGLGTLELVSEGRLLRRWRYTVARAAPARRFADRFEALQSGQAPKALPAAPAAKTVTCKTCGAPMRSGESACVECGASQSRSALRSLLRLFGIARQHWYIGLLGFVVTLASTASGLIPPVLTAPLIDNILVPFQEGHAVNEGLVRWYLLGLAAASILAWLLTWAEMYIGSWVSERVAATLRDKVYSHLQNLSLEYFGGKRTGDLISRVSSDTDRICYYLSVNTLDFVADIIMLAMISSILLSMDWQLASMTLLPLPLITFLVFRVQEKMGRGFSLGSRAWAEMTSILADTIPGIRVVKAFAQEQREIRRFQQANQRVLHTNDNVNRVWAFFYAVVVLLTDLGVLVVWMYGVQRVFHHSVKVGELTAFVALISRFYGRLDSMSRMVSATQRAAASAQRVFGVLDRVPKVAEATNPVQVERLDGSIELRQVSFRYGPRPILSNLNLKIQPGEMIGLVGLRGAGKTTLINLLCRFYDVTEGAILVDGVDIRSYPIGAFRRNVGLVLQEPFLFFGTIAENIAYGKQDATRDEIVAAARAARAHEFILRLANGYDSLVGERGQFLSGGERQRISIARALLIDPRILILDEATSSVDTETEREIQIALANLIQGRTTIAIAHRLSTLQRADRLVVMERGEIIETGSHQELLELDGKYAQLHRAQLEMQEGRLPAPVVEEEDDLAMDDEDDGDDDE